jgi:hypothetical protein
MIYFFAAILIIAVGTTVQIERFIVLGRKLRFNRFGERLMRVFPHLEWHQHSGGTFPYRFGTQQAHYAFLLLKWKRIPNEKRYYHQFYCERTPYCHS